MMKRRGTSIAGYSLAVGLVALTASLAVSRTGEQIDGLTTRVAGSVNAVDGAISGNQPPVFAGTLPATQSVEAFDPLTTLDFTGFVDTEGDTLRFEARLTGDLDRNDLVIDRAPDGYLISGTPAASGTITVIARDPIGRTARAGPVEIRVDPNDPPAMPTPPAPAAVTEGATVQLVYRDVGDPDDTVLDFDIPQIPDASFTRSGPDLTVSFTARPDSDGAVLSVIDPHGATTQASPIDLDVTPISCASLHKHDPQLPSGPYTIDPDGPGPRPQIGVTCDMDTDGGGWTVLTRQLVRDELGAQLTFDDPAQHYGIDSQDRPWTWQEGGTHVAFYTFAVPMDTTAFRPVAFDVKANSPGGNPSDAGTDGFQPDWSFVANTWGDIGFGTPSTHIASVASLGQQFQCTDCVTRHAASDVTFTLSGSTSALRIGWAEDAGHEGWYPWWSGEIYVR